MPFFSRLIIPSLVALSSTAEKPLIFAISLKAKRNWSEVLAQSSSSPVHDELNNEDVSKLSHTDVELTATVKLHFFDGRSLEITQSDTDTPLKEMSVAMLKEYLAGQEGYRVGNPGMYQFFKAGYEEPLQKEDKLFTSTCASSGHSSLEQTNAGPGHDDSTLNSSETVDANELNLFVLITAVDQFFEETLRAYLLQLMERKGVEYKGTGIIFYARNFDLVSIGVSTFEDLVGSVNAVAAYTNVRAAYLEWEYWVRDRNVEYWNTYLDGNTGILLLHQSQFEQRLSQENCIKASLMSDDFEFVWRDDNSILKRLKLGDDMPDRSAFHSYSDSVFSRSVKNRVVTHVAVMEAIAELAGFGPLQNDEYGRRLYPVIDEYGRPCRRQSFRIEGFEITLNAAGDKVAKLEAKVIKSET